MEEGSVLEEYVKYRPLHPCAKFLRGRAIVPLHFKEEKIMKATSHVAAAFPKMANKKRLVPERKRITPPTGLRVAVLFSGGPAAGGHNVLIGLQDVLKGCTLFGVRDGPGGFLKGDLFELKDLSRIRNTGGFDFLGTDRTKISTPQQLEQARSVCEENKLDALVIIGGDDSNTNAALLAEHLDVKVIGVPKTMDGDLQVPELPITFGFDTATKVYSELVGNLMKDCESSRKYWHFIKLMGRDASHVTLEVALQTQPTMAIIAEEVREEKKSLQKIVDELAACIHARISKGKDYGVILIPEGLLMAIPEMHRMFQSLGRIIAEKHAPLKRRNVKRRMAFLARKLSKQERKLFHSLPDDVRELISMKRDGHGNINVSWIETERLLIEMVRCRLKELGHEFEALPHFFGYEGRCGFPSVFDAMLTYNLGLTAGSLILDNRTGYMACFTDLEKGGRPVALPLTGILNTEERNGKDALVIKKTIINMDDPAFVFFKNNRAHWKEGSSQYPGPMHVVGPTISQLPLTVVLNQGYKRLEWKV